MQALAPQRPPPRFPPSPTKAQAMDHRFSLLLFFFLILQCVAAGADLPPKEYWHSVLPHTPMPSAIEQLVQPESFVGQTKSKGTNVNVGKGGVTVNTGKGTTVNVGRGGVGVNTGSGTTVNVGHGGVGVNTGKGTNVNVGHGGVGVNTGPTRKSGGTSVSIGGGGVGVITKPKGKPVVVQVNPKGSPFSYIYAAGNTQTLDDPSAAFFFRREDIRPGKEMTIRFTTTPGAASFLSRSTAEAIPLSAAELPTVLSHFGVPQGSEKAEAMRTTVEECAAPAAEGETKRCVTSLEGMVDFATVTLGTTEVAAVATEGGDGVLRRYRLTAAKRLAASGGKGVVSCHAEEYAYAVFFCHATRTSEVYVMEMTARDGGAEKVEAVAVCHVDTHGWNPKHVAFVVLGVKPGTVPVCHFLPRDHVLWAPRG